MPYEADVQNQMVYDDFGGELMLSAGVGQGEYVSQVYVVALRHIAPILDVGMIFQVTQDTYDNDVVKIAVRGSANGIYWTAWQIWSVLIKRLDMYNFASHGIKLVSLSQLCLNWQNCHLSARVQPRQA
ncbi:MAG: hypothetical protein MUE54_14640 [Anaerolineae bacterium]|nr:hypothetical protein [Anaerolineae bacterium]